MAFCCCFVFLISLVYCMVLINRIQKGGGPYGAGVTRGQDLSGKDFSGRTLIKQDFKTVCVFEICLFMIQCVVCH